MRFRKLLTVRFLVRTTRFEAVGIAQVFIDADHHRVERRRFARLPGGQLEVQRAAQPEEPTESVLEGSI